MSDNTVSFAAGVAGLWLKYVNGLIDFSGVLDDFEEKEKWSTRVEANLKHLESSTLPMPGMTLEEVLAAGRDMEEDLGGPLVPAVKDTHDHEVRIVCSRCGSQLQIDRSASKIRCYGCDAEIGISLKYPPTEEEIEPEPSICTDCKHSVDSKTHLKQCSCPHCRFKLGSKTHQQICNKGGER